MKRYLVFGGEAYYPEGGWGDFVGDFSSLKAAMRKATKIKNEAIQRWAEVADTEIGEIVFRATLTKENMKKFYPKM